MSNISQNNILNNKFDYPSSQQKQIINKNNLKNKDSSLYEKMQLIPSYMKRSNSSLNILNRNLLSVNNSNFDHLKKVKNQSTIFQLDKNENNYLHPLSNYSFNKDKIKEDQKRNIINSLEWLNIIKNKIFTMDINTKIKKGQNITKSQFYEEKNKSIISPNKILNNNIINDNNNNNVIKPYQFKNYMNNKRYDNGIDYKYNSAISMDNIFNCKRFKKDSEEITKRNIDIKDYLNKKEKIDYWKQIKLKKEKSLDNIDDEHLKEKSQKLRSNSLYFDQNHKNWWKIDA